MMAVDKQSVANNWISLANKTTSHIKCLVVMLLFVQISLKAMYRYFSRIIIAIIIIIIIINCGYACW